MYKLGHLVDASWTEHCYPRTFMLPASPEVSQRIVAGVPFGDPQIFLHLVAALKPPMLLLYVLHTPRGEGEPGRYQSPPLSMDEIQDFFAACGNYLSQDARFDMWAYSPSEQASVIWDRHNQIFAYGPLRRFEAELRALGFSQGIVSVPAPHEHHYHSEFDTTAKRVLRFFEWSYSPLQDEDEQ